MATSHLSSRPSHHSRASFSSVASTSSGTDLPYANSCLEYGLEIITRALTEEGLDSPRSSTYSRLSPIAHHTHHCEDASCSPQRVGKGKEGSGRSDTSSSRRFNSGVHARNSSSAWHVDRSSREGWRLGTIFLDDDEQFGESSRRGSERSSNNSSGWRGLHPYATSTDMSSDDGRSRNDSMGPLTPPESTADDSDDDELWIGTNDKVPEWAAPDIVDCYRNGWSDERKYGPTSGDERVAGRKGGEDASSEYAWRKDAEDGDDHSQSGLHFPSSGRSVLPAGRLLLNTLSEEGPNSDASYSSYTPPLRPDTGDARGRDESGWFDSFHPSQSVTSLTPLEPQTQPEEDAKVSRPGPRLRGMRSMLLTRPVALRPSAADRRETGALREFARLASPAPLVVRPETTSLTIGTRTPARSDASYASSPLAPVFTPRKYVPSVQSMSSLNSTSSSRKYHYQKSQNPLRAQTWDDESSMASVSIKTSEWSDDASRVSFKREKPAPLSMQYLGGDVSPGWQSANPATHTFQLLTPSARDGKLHLSPPGSPEDAFINIKSVKDRKKRGSRMGALVGKVFSTRSNPGDSNSKRPLGTMWSA